MTDLRPGDRIGDYEFTGSVSTPSDHVDKRTVRLYFRRDGESFSFRALSLALPSREMLDVIFFRRPAAFDYGDSVRSQRPSA